MGVTKKNHVDGISMYESCFLAMEFPSVKWFCSTILRNLQGQSFAFSRISMGKVTINLKIPGVLSKKYFLNTPYLGFFWNNRFTA